MRKIYFVTSNKKKFEELKAIKQTFEEEKQANGEFDSVVKFELEQSKVKIKEVQADDGETLVRVKALEAFLQLKRPIIVDHTALVINAFGGLPDLQTSQFYEKIKSSGIVDYCVHKEDFSAKTITWLAYCDGRKIFVSKGEAEGRIIDSIDKLPVGKETFAWDDIFIPSSSNPEDEEKVYAECEKTKNSMRRRAWDQLVLNIKEEQTQSVNEDGAMKELAKLIAEKKVLLFVGAGISASVGLPAWNDLLKSAAPEDFDGDVFMSYGDNLLLAEYIEIMSDKGTGKDVWNELETQKKGIEERLKKSEIYKYIFDLDFPVIYTTNYDHLIEKYYEFKQQDVHKIVTVDDMDTCRNIHPRIMKFHGDLDNTDTRVFTQSQYFDRMDYQSFMDISLQSDLLKYHVLFLGYSLSDVNIKQLMYLSQKRKHNCKSKWKDYIFTVTPNEVQAKVFEKNNIVSISGDVADKGEGTKLFLEKLNKLVNDYKKTMKNLPADK
jgi:non-canonical purine NTP pyrophosphatase (RdgB/HAM1 family)